MADLLFKPRKTYCIDCDTELYVNENGEDFDTLKLFNCPKCHYQCVALKCPFCDNIDFLDNFTDQPTSWTCTKCETEYNFPDDFYTTQNHCYQRNELPEDAIQYLIEEEKKELFHKKIRKITALVIITIIIVIFTYILIKKHQ